LPSNDPPVPLAPRDPAAFRALVLRRAARIERHRRAARAGGWALGVLAVAVSAFALVTRVPTGRSTERPAAPLAVTRFPVGAGIAPRALAPGADGNLWCTADGANPAVVRIGVDGATTTFALPPGSQPAGIIAGADGALWFTDPGRDRIGQITTVGSVQEWAAPSSPGASLALAPDGSVWFAEPSADAIGKITLAGVVSAAPLPAGRHPTAVAAGPDGAIWFAEQGAPFLGRVASTGAVSELSLPNSAERVAALTPGPGPAVWYVASTPDRPRLGHVDTTGRLVEQPLPLAEAPTVIGLGPDGHLWLGGPGVGLVTATASGVRTVPLTGGVTAGALVAGADGSLWAVDPAAHTVDRISLRSTT
jgi:virginiamycin B lyase